MRRRAQARERRERLVPPSAWAADETPAPARATRAARNPDENRMIPPVSLDDSQTGIGGADFDETMTDQLGDLAARLSDGDAVTHSSRVHEVWGVAG
jgi:hypothetical protein